MLALAQCEGYKLTMLVINQPVERSLIMTNFSLKLPFQALRNPHRHDPQPRRHSHQPVVEYQLTLERLQQAHDAKQCA